ncbi:hypothetical protein D3871_13725 [Noviherbaspirillum saxi]|uniref:Uncharacterized protein n=1 Tax=Noviherbaspirillum saxi TaxID=2320863 RepID=A0A3A3FTU3_9BURK|nr:hypothetical protein D3871_13725 [Noviherbaspirillum saxi]
MFLTSSTAYAGGGETHLRFSVPPYDYVVYDRTTSKIRAENGERAPEFSAGLVVKKNGHIVRRLRCTDSASANIAELAYDALATEDFKSLED